MFLIIWRYGGAIIIIWLKIGVGYFNQKKIKYHVVMAVAIQGSSSKVGDKQGHCRNIRHVKCLHIKPMVRALAAFFSTYILKSRYFLTF